MLTLAVGPLNCRLQFGDCLTEKTVHERYREFITNSPSENFLQILPSSKLSPGEGEFDLRLRVNDDGFCFVSSSTDGYFNPVSRCGVLNISTSRLDNPATIENALRHLFGILALNHGHVFIHGAACSRGDKAWIFLGPSGSGKSTIASFARKRGYRILSDDYVLLGGTKQLRAFSSPFFGEVRPRTRNQESFAVENIYIIRKTDSDSVSSIDSPSEKAVHLLANVPCAEMCDTPTLNKILDVVERIAKKTRLYRMRFTNSPNFLDLLENQHVL